MADHILQAGSCLKQDLYKTIRGALLAAGWENVSSLTATDYDILRSSGMDGTRDLYVQMRPHNTSGQNSIETTDYPQMSIRLLDTYTPGPDGVAGTIGRAANAWLALPVVTALSTATVPKETLMTYRLYADKNKLIMAVWPPNSMTTYQPVVFFIGLPDTLYTSEPESRGVIFANNCAATTAGNVLVSNTPGDVGSIAQPQNLPVIAQLAPKNPNVAGAYCISEIYYGNVTEGARGKIDGIYALPNANILNGDILTIGTKQYLVLVAASYYSGTGTPLTSSFPSAAVAVRIA